MVKRDDLVRYMNERLQIDAMEDFSHNGLQVQGRSAIRKVGLATDAALAVYRSAARQRCDLLVVHHGIIWGGIRAITGREHAHVKFLIDHDINLYAAHLPLDAHPELGNNAGLARMVALQDPKRFGTYHGVTLGFFGRLPRPLAPDRLARIWQRRLGGKPLVLPFGPKQVRTVAISSGGSSSMLPEAIALGADCFVSGEGRHEDHHLAREGGINVIYLGHYQSETVGVKALGEDIEKRFSLTTVFIDEPTVL